MPQNSFVLQSLRVHKSYIGGK